MATIWSRAVNFQGSASGRRLCVLEDGRCAIAYRERSDYGSTVDVTHVRMYGADGSDLWHAILQDLDTDVGTFTPGAIGVTAANDLFVLGQDGGRAVLLAKLSEGGTLLWTRSYVTTRSASSYTAPYANALLVQDDRLLIAGGISNNQEALYLRLDYDGNLVAD